MRFLLVPLVVILLAMIPKSAEAQSDRFMTDDTLPWIHFSWSSGNLGGRLIEKTAMIVPLKIEELPYAFEAQFDLGACSTMIYGKAFAPYLAMASDIREKIDTTQTVFLQGASYPCFADLSIQLDGVEFPNRRVVFFEDFGTEMTKDSLCTSTIKHIGTIAADLFRALSLRQEYNHKHPLVYPRIKRSKNRHSGRGCLSGQFSRATTTMGIYWNPCRTSLYRLYPRFVMEGIPNYSLLHTRYRQTPLAAPNRKGGIRYRTIFDSCNR